MQSRRCGIKCKPLHAWYRRYWGCAEMALIPAVWLLCDASTSAARSATNPRHPVIGSALENPCRSRSSSQTTPILARNSGRDCSDLGSECSELGSECSELGPLQLRRRGGILQGLLHDPAQIETAQTSQTQVPIAFFLSSSRGAHAQLAFFHSSPSLGCLDVINLFSLSHLFLLSACSRCAAASSCSRCCLLPLLKQANQARGVCKVK